MADNFEIIKCPACQKEMVKVFIPSEGINIDICLNGCGGIYFDNREFTCFDEPQDNIDEITQAIEGKTFETVDKNLPRCCPVCGAKMVKNHESAKKEILVDDCYFCGGKFLDFGELQKIRSQYDTEEERTQDFINMIYNTIGKELKELQDERQRLRDSRSLLKKLFDKMMGF